VSQSIAEPRQRQQGEAGPQHDPDPKLHDGGTPFPDEWGSWRRIEPLDQRTRIAFGRRIEDRRIRNPGRFVNVSHMFNLAALQGHGYPDHPHTMRP